MSKKIYNTLKELIEFNYKNIYLKANTKEQSIKIEKMFTNLFDLYYTQIINEENNEEIYTIFLNSMSSEYLNKTTPARKVIDYISGMTDNFFIEQYKKYFLV